MSLPSLNVNVSLFVPPIKFSILLKPVPNPVNVPALSLVIVQAFTTLSPVKVSVPVLPLIEPVNVPPFKVKLSAFVPPTKLAKLVKVNVDDAPVNVPLFAPVTFQAVAAFSPFKVLLHYCLNQYV